MIKHDQANTRKYETTNHFTTTWVSTNNRSFQKKQQFWSMFSIKHPTSIGRPSKFLMFCRSEGEAAPPSAARCSFLCYTAAVRYRGLQTQQATDREGLGQKKTKESQKKTWKVGRNLQKFHENAGNMMVKFSCSICLEIRIQVATGWHKKTKWIRVGWHIQL